MKSHRLGVLPAMATFFALLAVTAITTTARLSWPVADGAPGEAVREAIRIRLESAVEPSHISVGSERIHAGRATSRFYEARAFQPAWTVSGNVRHDAVEVLDVISRADEEGLEPSHYHAGLVRSRLQTLDMQRGSGRTPLVGEIVDLELLLTDAYLLYGSHMLSGHVDPKTIDPEWFADQRGGDMAESLAHALKRGDISESLAALAPPQPGYRRLKDALARYRAIERWPRVEETSAWRLGDRNPNIARLRARLETAGDLARSTSDAGPVDLFDEELDGAVRRFQARHGLDEDGIVGADTFRELNRSVEDRIQQIVVNLERWRWLPQSLGRRHVLVNIAGFTVRAVKDGVPTLELRAIVGRQYHRTPVFSDLISYLVLNPSWTIPTSIAVQDKLPLIRKDPSYLGRQNIKVYSGWGVDAREVDPASIDWNTVSGKNFPFRLRQEPGPLNALGSMKFMFPNRFNVYLHDTPDRELFAKSIRDFSSGCIRVEKSQELALFLLEPLQGWNSAKLESSLATQREQTISLLEPVPIHIQYWTGWVDETGTVSFRNDHYGRDQQVAEALQEPPPQTQNRP